MRLFSLLFCKDSSIFLVRMVFIYQGKFLRPNTSAIFTYIFYQKNTIYHPQNLQFKIKDRFRIYLYLWRINSHFLLKNEAIQRSQGYKYFYDTTEYKMCNQINHLDQLVIYQLSIHSTMNPLSPDLDIILKDYSHQALLRLLSKVETQQEEKTVGIFNCTPNQQYIIKRLINACLSRQTEVKFNAYFSLSAFITRFSSVVSKLNSINLYQYITSQSKIKDCQGKTSQIQAYVTGKILTLKAFRQILKDNIEVINELIKLTQKFPQFEEQFIQLASLLATSKKSQLAFSKLSPNTKAGFVLFSILRANNKHQNFALTEAIINDVLAQLVPQYPKMSICISYLGAKLNQMENPGKYLQTLFQAAFGDQVDEFNFRKIYFALQLLQSHLKNTVITKQNVSKSITPGLVGVWLSQTKVQNKNIKKLASEIKLSIQDDKQLAFNILKELHNAKISLSNLNVRHPLYSVYEAVDADTYSQFLLELCSQDTSSIQTEQNSETIPIDQLQMFVVLFNKKIKAELLANVVQLFAARYKNKKQDVHLQALSAIFNSIFAFSNKKKNKINTRLAVILSKVNVDNLDLGQNLNEIKDSIKVIRKHVKEAKQDQGAFVNSFLNFQLALGLYFLMYPEEIELHSDLQCAYDDIKTTFLHKQQGLKPKKKRKVNPEQDKNKPIHVLVDILISLLTKSPQFLRSTINPLFQQLIPYVDSQDLSHLFEVIQRPDEEYIEDIQNE